MRNKKYNKISHFLGKKVLVTGASGFIGSHLWHRLSQTDVERAVDIISGTVEEVLAYLKKVQENLEALPSFYPSHFKFDEVRVKVKVREERRNYNEEKESKRERRLWEGNANLNDESRNPYNCRDFYSKSDDANKDETRNKKIKILNWDTAGSNSR